MKRKDLEQIKNKPKAELQEELKKQKEKLWTLKVDLKSGKVKNVREIRSIKKKIAVVNTILSSQKINK